MRWFLTLGLAAVIHLVLGQPQGAEDDEPRYDDLKDKPQPATELRGAAVFR